MTIRRSKVLLADPDAGIRRLVQRRLKTYGCIFAQAGTLAEALAALTQWPPDMIVLGADLDGAGGATGLEVLRRIRRQAPVLPVLCLVGQAGTEQVPLLLDQGADDCLVKPFLASELTARLHRLLHRQDVAARPALLAGTAMRQVKLVPQGGYVEIDRGRLPLTPRQVDVLGVLIKADGAVVQSGAIVAAVWGPGRPGTPQTLHRVIAQLRRRIEPDPARPALIVTVRGVGYRFGASVTVPRR
jgi:two-component system response regulator MtrA